MTKRKVFVLSCVLAWNVGCSGNIASQGDGNGAGAGSGAGNGGGGKPSSTSNGGAGGGGSVATELPAATVRRLTASQLRNTVEDLFGPGLTIPEVDGEPALMGFTSVGASAVATSPTGVERYHAAAESIASQVFADTARRDALVGCKPTGAADAACARTFLARFGRLVYRRTVPTADLDRLVKVTTEVAALHNSFWKGAEAVVTALLQSPKFLYRSELGEPASGGHVRFKGAELASRLSFFVWNSAPDAALLDAAERGDLDAAQGLEAATTRLLASDKAARGFRTFFEELLRLGSAAEARDAAKALATRMPEPVFLALREQTLMTMQDWFLERGGDWGSLMRSPDTFLSRDVAQHYGGLTAASTALQPGSFGKDGQRIGLLGHASFLIKTSNQPDTSPSARGLVIRDAMFCQEISPPPPGVSTDLPPLVADKPVTMRERLRLHQNNPSCASCHKNIDSIGLGLENFDALGKWRTKEHGLDIDPAGSLDGVAFKDARGLLDAISRHPELGRCFVRQLTRNAIGQHEPEGGVLEDLASDYDKGGVSLASLVTTLVKSPLFLEASQPL